MPQDDGFLKDKKVCFTGRLASLTRAQAAAMVRERGGSCASSVSSQTSILVVGQDGWPLQKDGQLTKKLRLARSLAMLGKPIEVLSEDDWLTRLGVTPNQEERRLYNTAELSSLLQVPGDRLRKWAEIGLLKPAKTVEGVGYFDYSQAVNARTLLGFTQAGISMSRLRRSVEQLQKWLGNEQPLLQLSALEKSGEILVRLDDGLADPSGQRCFDFAETETQPTVTLPESTPSADELFELACTHEDAGRLDEAVELYRKALLVGGPDATTCFNLANALCALGKREAAIERYYQAVELNPEFAQAWNNLGTLLSDAGSFGESIFALKRALAIDPGLAEAHYNLADLLDESGETAKAHEHWLSYLTFDSCSPWQAYACQRANSR
jgi:tetratricopeptide (TPR) repeat protein